jgi:hypothetical protein
MIHLLNYHFYTINAYEVIAIHNTPVDFNPLICGPMVVEDSHPPLC